MFHHETLIFAKKTTTPGKTKKYKNSHEYIFVFTKQKINTKNLILRKTKNFGLKKVFHSKHNDTTKAKYSHDSVIFHDHSVHNNVFFYNVGWNHSYKDNLACKHSAVMNIQLAKDLVYSYSNKEDLVFDPFGGSGTTAIAAKTLGRNFVLTEISDEYCKLSNERISLYKSCEFLYEYETPRDNYSEQMYLDFSY
jgi:site-specific DNA-methyltransferase (adenine-specific)